MKRKKVITIEIERDLVINSRSRKVSVVCPECGTQVQATVTIEGDEISHEAIAAQLLAMSEKGLLHARHDAVSASVVGNVLSLPSKNEAD
jgi:hypothetical protein